MSSAAVLLLYGLVVALYVPALLSRLTVRGMGVRLGIVAWLVAMASVLASAVAATWFVVLESRGGVSRIADAVQGASTGFCSADVCRTVAFHAYLCSLAAGVSVMVGVLALRYVRTLDRARRQTRAHAEVARMAGRRASDLGVVVLDAPRPVAYCLPGRPPTIVVTDAALSVLDPAQLTAVMAHERAHLAGRHHMLLALTRGLAALFPGVPLFRQGAREVARLLEMCADDVAARRAGPGVLVTALLAMGTGAAVPVGAAGATGTGVAVRVSRLLDPPTRTSRNRCLLALAVVILGLALGWVCMTVVAGGLAAR